MVYVRNARESGKSIRRWKNATIGQNAWSKGRVYGTKYGDVESGEHGAVNPSSSADLRCPNIKVNAKALNVGNTRKGKETRNLQNSRVR